MKNIFLIFTFFLILAKTSFSFSESMTTIIGFAPKYIGEKVEIYAIEDYFSMKERLIASVVVKEDSTFRAVFFNSITQKVIIKSKNNKGFIYIDPNATYDIYLPTKNRFDEDRPLGNEVEISFRNLPESDINYKILSFDKWINNFLGLNFHKKNVNGLEFVQQLDTFKLNVEKAYSNDTSFFFQTYIRFSIAELDEIQFSGSRNRFEKFDFYLKKYPVMYQNNVYMEYLESFYKNIFTRLPMETNNRIYLGVLKSSPTLVANAMSEEITLRNAKILELVMIKSLSDSYFKGDFPQTNILSILDSISKHSLFKENGLIAENMIYKLTEVLPGTKAPNFALTNVKNESKGNDDFLKKHLYIQFIDLNIQECEKEVELLKPMYQKYKDDIEIISVYKKTENLSKKQLAFLANIPWQKFEITSSNEILSRFKINSYPSYVLIDAYGYVVASPALKPIPNGNYETIDKAFFYIQKMNSEEEK
ncbi:MAG: thioredoxin-like domain-containing protein [Bacteroidota bacterium]